jgi:hypothetical protein
MTNTTTTKALLLETSKKLNSALARKKYRSAFNLLQIKNSLRADLGQKPFRLPNLEARFNNN